MQLEPVDRPRRKGGTGRRAGAALAVHQPVVPRSASLPAQLQVHSGAGARLRLAACHHFDLVTHHRQALQRRVAWQLGMGGARRMAALVVGSARSSSRVSDSVQSSSSSRGCGIRPAPHLLLHSLRRGGGRRGLPLRCGLPEPLLLRLCQRAAQRLALRLPPRLLEHQVLLRRGAALHARRVIGTAQPLLGDGRHPRLCVAAGAEGAEVLQGVDWRWHGAGVAGRQRQTSVPCQGAPLTLASAAEGAAKKCVCAPQATLNTQPAFLGLNWALERSCAEERGGEGGWVPARLQSLGGLVSAW